MIIKYVNVDSKNLIAIKIVLEDNTQLTENHLSLIHSVREDALNNE